MDDAARFALLILLVAAVGLVAVMSNHLSAVTKIPAPLLFLAGATVAVRVIPDLHAPPAVTVQRIATLALVVILFTGGTEIGLRRFSQARAAILSVGVFGTLLTTAAVACVGALVLGLGWYAALLLAAAISPTDPAVVFSVLGQREIAGRSGTILQGESGANDPVGIALMAGLLSAGGLSAGAAGHAAAVFGLEMVVGGIAGAIGGRALGVFVARVRMPAASLYPLRTLACVFLLYAATTVAGGSGFLAVFIAGILVGDDATPYKHEIESFFSALASIAEIVVFVALGLTVNLRILGHLDVWLPGLVLAAVLMLLIRPLCVGVCLAPAGLSRREAGFVLFAGLKGAVPILLGSYFISQHVPEGARLYGIVAIVVLVSVLVQGGLVPLATTVLALPVRIVEQEPWSIGVRLQAEPQDVVSVTIADDSAAVSRTIAGLDELPADSWISLIVRGERLVPAVGSTALRAGDRVVVLAPRDAHPTIRRLFGV